MPRNNHRRNEERQKQIDAYTDDVIENAQQKIEKMAEDDFYHLLYLCENMQDIQQDYKTSMYHLMQAYLRDEWTPKDVISDDLRQTQIPLPEEQMFKNGYHGPDIRKTFRPDLDDPDDEREDNAFEFVRKTSPTVDIVRSIIDNQSFMQRWGGTWSDVKKTVEKECARDQVHVDSFWAYIYQWLQLVIACMEWKMYDLNGTSGFAWFTRPIHTTGFEKGERWTTRIFFDKEIFSTNRFYRYKCAAKQGKMPAVWDENVEEIYERFGSICDELEEENAWLPEWDRLDPNSGEYPFENDLHNFQKWWQHVSKQQYFRSNRQMMYKMLDHLMKQAGWADWVPDDTHDSAFNKAIANSTKIGLYEFKFDKEDVIAYFEGSGHDTLPDIFPVSFLYRRVKIDDEADQWKKCDTGLFCETSAQTLEHHMFYFRALCAFLTLVTIYERTKSDNPDSLWEGDKETNALQKHGGNAENEFVYIMGFNINNPYLITQ